MAVEFRSPLFGWLTYARTVSDPEDISFFDRERGHNLSLYASAAKVAERGRFYDEDAGAAYDVLQYGLDVAFDPSQSWIEGRGRLRIRVLADTLQSVSFRLAESLAESSVTSPDQGRCSPCGARSHVGGRQSAGAGPPRPEMTVDIVRAAGSTRRNSATRPCRCRPRVHGPTCRTDSET